MKTIIDFDGNPIDAYSKDEVIDMFKELKKEIDTMSELVVKDGTITIDIQSFGGSVIQKKISKLMQSKIDKLQYNID